MRNDATITIRVPSEEKELWEEAAAVAQMKLSDWIRDRLRREVELEDTEEDE